MLPRGWQRRFNLLVRQQRWYAAHSITAFAGKSCLRPAALVIRLPQSSQRAPTTRCFCAPAVVRVDGSWADLPDGQKRAWEALGWSADSWDGRRDPPVSELKHWDELDNMERAAAMHGLGYNQQTWDSDVGGDLIAGDSGTAESTVSSVTSSATTDLSSSATSSKAASLALSILPAVKAFVKSNKSLRESVIGRLIDVAGEVGDAVVTAQHGGLITVTNTENVVFLDDSGSMESLLPKAIHVWGDIAERLKKYPTRIVKFGFDKHVIMPRSDSILAMAVSVCWDASSGGTYMWEMILKDIQDTYKPGPGLLRVFVITDGADVLSPPPFQGMEGMDPMMKQLIAAGFNIQFHIVFVQAGIFFDADELSHKDVMRYKDLALATGGRFLLLDGNESDADRERFLEHVQGAADRKATLRVEARQEYEKRLQLGEGTQFDWYKKSE
eukprot:TRINITY_DN70842_c0_g1_i1.p1 TRINITY_DN70842_c0_g1~~TRINITY_DN70842_c0_g1_i1.p1  ORF type:complete len:441 (+),score=82.32 TRINITY_DN70842_c0_g1_i1:78-1400(+)